MGGIWAIEASNKVNSIKRYYFGDTMVTLGNPADPQTLSKQKQLRAATGPYDDEIIGCYAEDFKKLAEGEHDNWYDDTDGVLAIIIMFQFFSKFMFRGDKRAYQFDQDAVILAKYIVEQTDYQKMYTDYQMLLVVSPLGLSEDAEDNQLAISLITAKIEHYQMQGKGVPRYLKHISLLEESLNEFLAHHEIVAEFGRDPRRNADLGRENNEEEDAYMQRF